MGARHHRWPRVRYIGRIYVEFTLCLQGRDPFFITCDRVRVFVDFLTKIAEKHQFSATYCFMPDHVHLIFLGRSEEADLLAGLEAFKQASGYWLSVHAPSTKWQRSFY